MYICVSVFSLDVSYVYILSSFKSMSLCATTAFDKFWSAGDSSLTISVESYTPRKKINYEHKCNNSKVLGFYSENNKST